MRASLFLLKKCYLTKKKRFQAFKIIDGMPNKGVTLTVQKSSLLSSVIKLDRQSKKPAFQFKLIAASSWK